jgi:hypothetical protein
MRNGPPAVEDQPDGDGYQHREGQQQEGQCAVLEGQLAHDPVPVLERCHHSVGIVAELVGVDHVGQHPRSHPRGDPRHTDAVVQTGLVVGVPDVAGGDDQVEADSDQPPYSLGERPSQFVGDLAEHMFPTGGNVGGGESCSRRGGVGDHHVVIGRSGTHPEHHLDRSVSS